LRNIEQMTIKQLRQIMAKYVDRQKRTKPPLAEEVTLEVTIAPDAVPGEREIRVQTPGGLSNPRIFQVGKLPELREKDRKDDAAVAPPPAEVPVVINGQIMPGEVDRFPLILHGGQKLTISAQARHLIPYMADAVPGWCQTVLTLYDVDGKEIAFADNNTFDPDPSFVVQAPKDGNYVLAVRDALYRGREDFVYRVTVCEGQPDLALYPFANIGRVPADDSFTDVDPLLPFVDSQLPLCAEIEPNNVVKNAQQVTLPQLIKGCINQPGDVDLYQFNGKSGDTLVAEVYARRLGSPLDSLLRVFDATGKVLAWNDDHDFGEMGLITHQSDSYLTVKIPADGIYYAQVSDAQRHGGAAYNYFLRLGPPQGDFVLRVTPSNINVTAGGTATMTVYAFRKDGWDGDIQLALTDAPEYKLAGAKIPAGQDHATVTLTAPRKKDAQPLVVHLEGQAVINGKTIIRPVIPAERLMQAFAYYHLVPAQQLLVTFKNR